MEAYLTADGLAAFVALASMEIVLGIDNIVFIAVITERLEKKLQPKIRRIGLFLAMIQRILLLMALSWMAKLTEPLVSFSDYAFSGRDLILLFGGLFLIGKATLEIHHSMEPDKKSGDSTAQKVASVGKVLVQIVILDTVFSLDSVITAVGMANDISIMVGAVVLACIVMVVFANPVSEFILKHPTVKMLALSFLLLVGVVLVADGTGHHVSKGYIYSAMGFSVLVEFFNFKVRQRQERLSTT